MAFHHAAKIGIKEGSALENAYDERVFARIFRRKLRAELRHAAPDLFLAEKHGLDVVLFVGNAHEVPRFIALLMENQFLLSNIPPGNANILLRF